MTNINKLRGKIVENGYTVERFSEALGINNATMHRKLGTNGEGFTIGEANKIVTLLKLSPEEALAIFFTNLVAKTRLTEGNDGNSN